MTVVKMSIGHTANTGNFENIRVEVGLEDDLRPDETIAEAYDRVYAELEIQLEKRLKKLIDDLGN